MREAKSAASGHPVIVGMIGLAAAALLRLLGTRLPGMPDLAARILCIAGGMTGAAAAILLLRTALRYAAKRLRTKPSALLLKCVVLLAAVVTFAALIFLIIYILIHGVPNLKPALFAWEYNSENVSLLPALINTLMMTVLALLIAAPLGIFTAIYLVEYAGRGSKLVEVIRVTAETLSGIPSIVYGLFGMLFFVTFCRWRLSLLAGACTVAIMILPFIIRTTEEALIAVPDTYREASYGIGAGRLRTVFKVVLPSALPGILAGIILAVGRIVGETAALIYTAGTLPQIASGANFLFDSTRTLAVHMYLLSSEGFHTEEAYATAVVLLVMVLAINGLSNLIASRLSKGKCEE